MQQSAATRRDYEIPTVLPSNHITSENSIINNAWSHVRSTTKPKTVIPARLFSKYVTAVPTNWIIDQIEAIILSVKSIYFIYIYPMPAVFGNRCCSCGMALSSGHPRFPHRPPSCTRRLLPRIHRRRWVWESDSRRPTRWWRKRATSPRGLLSPALCAWSSPRFVGISAIPSPARWSTSVATNQQIYGKQWIRLLCTKNS